jgi:hypothetical protein
MNCACPPLSEYTPAPCCRPEAEPHCGDRCLHPEPGAQDLFDQYQETVRMLRDAAQRYQDAQREVVEAQNVVHVLSLECEHLWAAAREAVAKEVGAASLPIVGTGERPAEGLRAALTAPVANTVPLPDLG